MKQRKCKECGKIFLADPGSDQSFCPDCIVASKKASVLRERVCSRCGASFLGYPRSKYCSSCQKEAQKEIQRKSRERKKTGKTRSIGSVDICQDCGCQYVVASGLQKYCPDCAKIVVPENIRSHKRQYMRKNKAKYSELQSERRSMRRICVICGKVFDSKTCTNTCSDQCRKEQKRRLQVEIDVKRGKASPERILGPRGPVNPQSGVPGVHLHSQTGKWELVLSGKYYGLFDTVAEASAARDKILKEKETTES